MNLSVVDARRHMHLLGPTDVGKTTLIARLVLSDFEAGRGAVVIDPKGDLVEDLLQRIPAGREDEVDLLDPLDEAPPDAISWSAFSAACLSATGVREPTTFFVPRC